MIKLWYSQNISSHVNTSMYFLNGIRSHGLEVLSGYEPLNIGAGDLAPAYCKRKNNS